MKSIKGMNGVLFTCPIRKCCLKVCITFRTRYLKSPVSLKLKGTNKEIIMKASDIRRNFSLSCVQNMRPNSIPLSFNGYSVMMKV